MTKKTQGAPPSEGNKAFFALCRIAVIVTVILALSDISLNITCMVLHLRSNKDSPQPELTIFGIFNWYYLRANGTWSKCSNGVLSTVDKAPRKETSSDAVFIWIIVYLLLDISWVVSALVMAFFASESSKSKSKPPYYIPWAIITGAVLIYELTAAIVFIIDIQEPLSLKDCDAYSSEYLMATLVLPLYFSKGILIWIAVLALLVMVIVKGLGFQPPATLFGDGSHLGRSLSQYHQDPQEQVLNKRAVEQLQMPRQQQFSQMQSPIFLNTAEERRVSDANWAYANESFDPDYPYDNDPRPSPWTVGNPVAPRPEPAAVVALKPPRKISEMSQWSELSLEPRRIGHPSAAPAVKSDYSIPRAKPKVAAGELRAVAGGGRRPIRTPSGRSVKAADYLKDYTPRPPTLKEEDNVERYFVKLKD